MAKGKNYRQAILAAVEEMNAWGKEVHLDALAMDTGIEPHKITGSISLMRHEGYPIDVVRREGRKILSWKFQNRAKWSDRTDAPSIKPKETVASDVSRVLRHFEAAGFGQAVSIPDIIQGTDLELVAVKKVIRQNDISKGGRIEMVAPGVYKLHEHAARQVRNEARQAAGALKQVHKGTNFFTQAEAGYASVRDAANAIRGTDADEVMRAAKGYTDEDLEYGRRVLLNFDRLPKEVKDKIEVLKEVAPEFTEDLENVLVKVLGAKPVQDSDPTFWAVDQFADGSLMLARKDGTHWKATKL